MTPSTGITAYIDQLVALYDLVPVVIGWRCHASGVIRINVNDRLAIFYRTGSIKVNNFVKNKLVSFVHLHGPKFPLRL